MNIIGQHNPGHLEGAMPALGWIEPPHKMHVSHEQTGILGHFFSTVTDDAALVHCAVQTCGLPPATVTFWIGSA